MRQPTTWLLMTLLLGACLQQDKKPRPSVVINQPVVNRTTPYVAGMDKSPMDIVYYPVDYPQLKSAGKTSGSPKARIIYSRPQLGGRQIFGVVQPYGQPWRLGANEATEIEFFSRVEIQKKSIPAGRYILYCIPQPDEWTLILNTDLYTWGLEIDSTRDVFRFTVPVSKTVTPTEVFTIDFEKATVGFNLLVRWETTEVKLPIRD